LRFACADWIARRRVAIDPCGGIDARTKLRDLVGREDLRDLQQHAWLDSCPGREPAWDFPGQKR
jgi:hypothetical protein